jgi:hypothetical protein
VCCSGHSERGREPRPRVGSKWVGIIWVLPRRGVWPRPPPPPLRLCMHAPPPALLFHGPGATPPRSSSTQLISSSIMPLIPWMDGAYSTIAGRGLNAALLVCAWMVPWIPTSHAPFNPIPRGGVLEMEWINRPLVGMAYSATRSTYRCRQFKHASVARCHGPETRA